MNTGLRTFSEAAEQLEQSITTPDVSLVAAEAQRRKSQQRATYRGGLMVVVVALAVVAWSSAQSGIEIATGQPANSVGSAAVAELPPTMPAAEIPTTTDSDEPFEGPTGGAARSELSEVEEVTVFVSPVEEALGLRTDRFALSHQFEQYEIVVADGFTRCLRSEGYEDYLHNPEPGPPPEAFSLDAIWTYSLEQFGYGVAAALRLRISDNSGAGASSGERQTPSLLLYLDELEPSEETAFLESYVGCEDQVHNENPRPLREIPYEIADEVRELRSAARISAQVDAAWSVWRSCFDESGYSFLDREAILDELVTDAAPVHRAIDAIARSNQPMSSQELEEISSLVESIAERERIYVEVDQRCAEVSNVDAISQMAITAIEQVWLDQNLDRVLLLGSKDTVVVSRVSR